MYILRESLCILKQKTNNETLIAMKNIAMRILVLLTVHSYKTKYNTIFTSQGFPWLGKMIIIYVIPCLNNYIYWRFLHSCK